MGPPATSRSSLTHLHWDHTLALPFFAPLYQPQNEFDFYGHMSGELTIDEALEAVMQPPWFPVSFRSAPATKRFHHLEGEPFTVEDISVTYTRLYHPQGVTGYRLERDRSSSWSSQPTSSTATRQRSGGAGAGRERRRLDLRRPVPPPEHHDGKIGWGHSTWQAATAWPATPGGVFDPDESRPGAVRRRRSTPSSPRPGALPQHRSRRRGHEVRGRLAAEPRLGAR